jgi:hypothetical protein
LPAEAERARRATTAARALRVHAGVYAVGAGVLIAVNWATGGSWWSFWPLAAWAVALGVHYLIYKAKAVDEDWAAERAADLRSKSYDAGHIDSIVERSREGALAPRADSTTTRRE